MTFALLFAPAALFLAVITCAVGIYTHARSSSLLARRHLDAYLPAAGTLALSPPATPLPLLNRRRFSSIPTLDRLLRAKTWGQRTSLELIRADLPLRPGEYLLLRLLLAAAALPLVGSSSWPAGLLAAAIGYWIPAAFVRQRQRRRVRQFEDHLVEGLSLLAGALKSGYSFTQAMQSVAEEIAGPFGSEFATALREIRMGKSVESALTAIGERVRSADFELVITAMVVQRQVGGNLTQILSNITTTVRERHRILGEVRTLTAEERLSGYVVAGLPVGLVLLLSILSPGYISGMLAASSGRMLLGAGAILEVLGLLLIRRIVAIEV